MKEKAKFFKNLLERDRLRRLIIIAGAVGAALILLSNSFSPVKTSGASAKSSVSDDRALEEKLRRAVECMEGAGKARVFVTLEDGGDASPFGGEEKEARARGVLVLCEGGEDPVVVARVSEALTKALGISSAKICIEKLTE